MPINYGSLPELPAGWIPTILCDRTGQGYRWKATGMRSYEVVEGTSEETPEAAVASCRAVIEHREQQKAARLRSIPGEATPAARELPPAAEAGNVG